MAEETTEAVETTEEPQDTEEVDYEAKWREAVQQSRKWEERAKSNKEKADKWDAYEQEGLSEAEKASKRAEKAEAELERLKAAEQRRTDAAEVSEKTGVPVKLLMHCADRADMEAFAKEYAGETKVPAAPSAPESRVIRGGEAAMSNRDRFASYFER